MENIRHWENFLKPLHRRQPKRNKNDYDLTKIDSKPSMSRDIALQLEQEVTIDQDDLTFYQHSLFEKQRQQARKNLFQTKPDFCNLLRAVTKRSQVSESPIYIDDSDHEDEDMSKTEETNVTTKHKLEETSVGDFSNNSKIQKLSKDEDMKSIIDGETVNGEVKIKTDVSPSKVNKNNLAAILRRMSTVPLAGSPTTPLNTVPPTTSPTFPPSTQPPHPLTTSPARSLVTMSSTQLPTGFQGVIQSSTPKDRPMIRPTRIVDHRSTSLSKWTFDMFTNYVDFKKYVRKLDLTVEPDSDVEHLTGYISTLYEDVLAMFGVKSLKDCMFRESNIRVLLNGLLLQLCKLHDVRLQTEEQSQLRYLPTGKFDYLFSTKDGHPLGCVEAKSPYSMDKKAFSQAVLELNLVQQIAHKKGVDIDTTPLFCILSDGYRFILMQLQGSELLLEHEKNGGEARLQFGKYQDEEVSVRCDHTIRIRKLDGEDDFRILVSAMSNIIRVSKTIAEKASLKREFFLKTEM